MAGLLSARVHVRRPPQLLVADGPTHGRLQRRTAHGRPPQRLARRRRARASFQQDPLGAPRFVAPPAEPHGTRPVGQPPERRGGPRGRVDAAAVPGARTKRHRLFDQQDVREDAESRLFVSRLQQHRDAPQRRLLRVGAHAHARFNHEPDIRCARAVVCGTRFAAHAAAAQQ